MIIGEGAGRDLGGLVVPGVGGLAETRGVAGEPYRLVDAAGVVVEPVSVFFRELLASGRSAGTVRSYGMDLLRWWRFLAAVDVAWDRASRIGARDFSCWIQASAKPRRGRTGSPAGRKAAGPANPVTGSRRRVRGVPWRPLRIAKRCCGRSMSSILKPEPGRSSIRSRWIGRGVRAGRTRTTTR